MFIDGSTSQGIRDVNRGQTVTPSQAALQLKLKKLCRFIKQNCSFLFKSGKAYCRFTVSANETITPVSNRQLFYSSSSRQIQGCFDTTGQLNIFKMFQNV